MARHRILRLCLARQLPGTSDGYLKNSGDTRSSLPTRAPRSGGDTALQRRRLADRHCARAAWLSLTMKPGRARFAHRGQTGGRRNRNGRASSTFDLDGSPGDRDHAVLRMPRWSSPQFELSRPCRIVCPSSCYSAILLPTGWCGKSIDADIAQLRDLSCNAHTWPVGIYAEFLARGDAFRKDSASNAIPAAAASLAVQSTCREIFFNGH